MSKRTPTVESDAERVIRRHVTELAATIQTAVVTGCDFRTPPPDQTSLPSLDDHYRALGMKRPPDRTTTHLRTRRAVQPIAVALTALINRGSFHGGDLFERCADQLIAHRAVLAAERAGWITRGKYEPSALQQFAGGKHHMPGTEWLHAEQQWSDPPLGHHWITETCRWLEVSDVETILREAAP